MNNLRLGIRLKSDTRTQIDPDFTYPTGNLGLSDEVILLGQIVYKKENRRTPEDGGNDPEHDGRIVIKRAKLVAAGYTDPVNDFKGAVISSVAGVNKWLKIVEIKDTAHLDGVSNTLTMLFMEDNKRQGG